MPTSPNDGGSRRFSERFNFDDQHRLNELATSMRQELISGVFRTFQEFLIEDINTRRYAVVGNYLLWLSRVDLFEVPSHKGDSRESMAIAVESSDATKRLRFHVSVPENFDRDSVEAVRALPEPNEIYAERRLMRRGAIGETMVRYAIERDRVYMYRSALDNQKGRGEEELHPPDEAIWSEFDRGFDSGIALIAALNEDLINWRRVKQTLVTRGDDGSVSAREV